MATDLNLHRKTIAQLPSDVSEETRALYERELANRERTWMYAYIIDRSYVIRPAGSSAFRSVPLQATDLCDVHAGVLQRVDADGQALLDRPRRLHHPQCPDVVARSGRDPI